MNADPEGFPPMPGTPLRKYRRLQSVIVATSKTASFSGIFQVNGAFLPVRNLAIRNPVL